MPVQTPYNNLNRVRVCVPKNKTVIREGEVFRHISMTVSPVGAKGEVPTYVRDRHFALLIPCPTQHRRTKWVFEAGGEESTYM